METLHTEVRALVGRLNNLHEIFRAQREILAYGEETIEPLAELLLSPPSTFPEPRVAAAECLGALGGDKAVDALIRILAYHELRDLGPVQRLAEETVRNAAARRLARFRQGQVIDALLSSLKRDHLIGAGEALAAMGETAAIPALIECLEDDVKKYKATEALISFGQASVPHLEDTLSQPRLVEGAEPPISQERRTRAAELLGQLGARETVPALKRGLYDSSSQVRVACALSLAKFEQAEEAIPELIVGLEDSELLVRMNCEETLRKIGRPSVSLLERAAAGESLDLLCGEQTRLTVYGRAAAIALLWKIGASEAVPFLLKLPEDPEEMVRVSALAALGHFSDERADAALLKATLSDPSASVRVTARRILKRRRNVNSLAEKVSLLAKAFGVTVKRFLDPH